MLLERKIQFNKQFWKDITKKMRKLYRMQLLKHWKDKNYTMLVGLLRTNRNQKLKSLTHSFQNEFLNAPIEL